MLDVTAELPRLASPTASGKDTYLCVPALDGQAPTPEQLEAAAAWVCAKWSEGEKVLVHCAFGIGVCSMGTALYRSESWFAHLASLGHCGVQTVRSSFWLVMRAGRLAVRY